MPASIRSATRQRLVLVGGEEVGAEAERGVVGEPDGGVLVRDAVDDGDGAEKLLAEGVVVGCDVGQDGRHEGVALALHRR